MARTADIALIRYESVRDPQRGANLAVLTCAAFAEPRPVENATWRLRLSRSGVQAVCDFPNARLGFPPDLFAADPRLSGFPWQR